MKAFVIAAVLCIGAGEAHATDDAHGLAELLRSVRLEVESLVEEARPKPPTPVALTFRARKIWSGEFSGELLDLEAHDLSGDGQDELVALTEDALYVLSRRRGLFDVRAQAAPPDVAAEVMPRTSIGLLSIEPGEDAVVIRARSSRQGVGATYVFRDGSLRREAEFLGYPICDGLIDAYAGRNFFDGSSVRWRAGQGPEFGRALQNVDCQTRLVDARGVRVVYRSEVRLNGTLVVHCQGAHGACTSPSANVSDSGYAHAVTDLDNDGHPEIAYAAATPRGSADHIIVASHVGRERKRRFERDFDSGVLAMTAGDFDGDGSRELLVAERGQGGRVSLWLLN